MRRSEKCGVFKKPGYGRLKRDGLNFPFPVYTIDEVKEMENWQYAQLSEEQLAEIQALEKKLGCALIAFESANRQEEKEPLEN